MARLSKRVITPVRPGHAVPRDFRDYMNEQHEWMNEQAALARELPAGEYVGRVVSFPYADSCAVYQVVDYDRSKHPTEQLLVARVDYCDGWAADPATVRGLIPADLARR